MNNLQQSLFDEAVEFAKHMPTEAVIDLIKDGYRRFPFLTPEERAVFSGALERLETLVESRTKTSDAHVAYWGSNLS